MAGDVLALLVLHHIRAYCTGLQLPEMLSERGEMFMVTVAENDPEGGLVLLSLVGLSMVIVWCCGTIWNVGF